MIEKENELLGFSMSLKYENILFQVRILVKMKAIKLFLIYLLNILVPCKIKVHLRIANVLFL